MQEYIEAVSFVHYIATASLVSQQHLEEQLQFDESLSVPNAILPMVVLFFLEMQAHITFITLCTPWPQFPVSLTDYLLGIADLTGELMRFAIASVGSGNQDEPMQISSFVRTLTQGKLLMRQWSVPPPPG